MGVIGKSSEKILAHHPARWILSKKKKTFTCGSLPRMGQLGSQPIMQPRRFLRRKCPLAAESHSDAALEKDMSGRQKSLSRLEMLRVAIAGKLPRQIPKQRKMAYILKILALEPSRLILGMEKTGSPLIQTQDR